MGCRCLGKSPQKAAITSSYNNRINRIIIRMMRKRHLICRRRCLWRMIWPVEILQTKSEPLIKSNRIRSCSFHLCITTIFRGASTPPTTNSSQKCSRAIQRAGTGSSRTRLKGAAYCSTETQPVSICEVRFSARSVTRGSKPMDTRIAWRRRHRTRALPTILT